MKWELLPYGKCDAVFDRGAFEAIEVFDRPAYVTQILTFIKPQFRYILNGFEYEDPLFFGPPRPINFSQLSDYFKDYSVEIISKEDYSQQGKVDFGVLNGMTDIHYLIKPLNCEN